MVSHRRRFAGVGEADGGAPGIQGAHVAERVGPGDGGDFSGRDVAGDGVGLDGVEPVGGFDDVLGGFAAGLDGDGAASALAAGAPPGRRDVDVAALAVDAQGVIHRLRDAGGDLRIEVAGEFQGGDGPVVDAGGAEAAGGGEADRVQEGAVRGGAGDQAGDGDGVAADIEDAAAAEGTIVGAGGGVVGLGVAEGRADQAGLADGAGAEQADEGGGHRVHAVHEGFHQEDVVTARGVDDGFGLGGVQANGLFAEDVLSGRGGTDGPFGVGGVRGGDVDGVHLGVGEQGLVAVVEAGAGEFGRGGAGGAAGDGVERAVAGVGEGGGKLAGDAAGAQDAPA